MENSIMTERLARRGLRVRHIYDYNPLRQIRVRAIMSSPATCVEADQPVVELFKLMTSREHPFASRKRLVVVRAGKAVGVIDRDQVYEAAAHADVALTAGEACSKRFETISQEEFAYEGLRKISMHNSSALVVVGGEGNAVGYLSRGDLTRALRRKIEDETLVEAPWYSRATGTGGENPPAT